MFDTVEKVVDDILTQLHADDIAAFKKMTLEEARFLHHGFGTWIRNTYSLWHTSPLTEKWRTDESSHDIRDGVDYSEDHPDQMSSKIIDALWHKLR